MRKKTIKTLLDNIFWYIIYLLPLIYCFFAWYRGNFDVTLETIFLSENSIFQLANSNLLVVPLFSIFSEGGYFPLLDDAGLYCLLIWFISCWIIHLAVDVLLFIVRWSHSMIDGFLGGKRD